jgi:predicted phosphodiesterase
VRIALLADVHGNLHALDAVLERLADEGVEAYVCAGDLVGYGPAPDECIARIAALPGVCVVGNHDLIALGRLTTDRCIPLAEESLQWTASRLDPASRSYLESLPATAAMGSVTVAHGSLSDPQEYVRRPDQFASQFRELALRAPNAEILVLGHTHQPLAVGERRGVLLRGEAGIAALSAGERYLVNPGSVGQSRDRRARARVAVLDLARREASFLEVPYDVRANRAALRRAGRPAWSSHLAPGRLARARRKAGRVARLARRGG